MMESYLNRESKEKRQHSTSYIPYGYYECRVPKSFLNVPAHWHPEFELNYVVKGRGEFLFDDEKCILEEGDILILPPDMIHGAYPVEEGEFIYDAFVFHQSFLGADSNDRATMERIRPIINGELKIPNLITAHSAHGEELRACVKTIITCAKQNTAHDDLRLKSELMLFFWLIDDAIELGEKKNNISYGMMMRPALEYMKVHLAENISIEQLAEGMHLSKSYFMACFKKAVGIGAIEYLTQLRMNAVCDLLITTDLSVADIALQCGYNNLSNFNRQFRKAVGQTPNEYRNRHY